MNFHNGIDLYDSSRSHKCWENSELIFPLRCRCKMDTFGSNKKIIENREKIK